MVSATVKLYKDIGLDPAFHKTMLFDTKDEQATWFASRVSKTLTDVNYNKLENSFAIHEDFGDMYGYTYVSLHNIDSSDRVYYGFISGVVLVDEETTRFTIVLDPIQTFMTEWSIGESFVVKEHVDRWTKISSLPARIMPSSEGVNTEYIPESNDRFSCGNYRICIIAFENNTTYYKDNYLSSGEEFIFRNTFSGDGILYGLIPIKVNTSDVDETNLGLQFQKIKKQIMYAGAPTVSTETLVCVYPTLADIVGGTLPSLMGIDPTSVIGMWILPRLSSAGLTGSTITVDDVHVTDVSFFDTTPVYYTASERDGSDEHQLGPTPSVFIKTVTNGPDLVMQIATQQNIMNLFKSTGSMNVSVSYPTKPTSISNEALPEYEPALYMYPYRKRSIAKNNGAVIMNITDNQFFVCLHQNANRVKLNIKTAINTMGPTNIYTLDGVGDSVISGVVGAIGIDQGTELDVVSDKWLSYCLTARDSDRRMMWSSIASNAINQGVFMGYGGALVGSRSNSGKNDKAKNANATNVPGYDKAMKKAMGWGVGASLITSAVTGVDMWNQQNAKEQTIRNTPNELLAMGQSWQHVMEDICPSYCEVKADDTTMAIAFENFRKYGYMVNVVETPNIKSRCFFNYICTANTTIDGALPADVKQSIIDILEKGITFFHSDYSNTTEYPDNENVERSIL